MRREQSTRLGQALPLMGFALVACAVWACGRGGLIEAPSLPSGAKYAVLPASEDAGSDAAERRTPTGPLREGDVFKGTSFCRGGPTTVLLRIQELDGDEVHGTVELNATRAGASGTYRVTGTYSSQNHRMKLEAGDWVDESDELDAADLEGTLGPSGFQGRLSTPGCGSFTLARDGAR